MADPTPAPTDWLAEFPWLLAGLRCPECGNRVIGTLAGGVPIGPEAIGRAWPKHYKRTEATGCPHSGASHLVQAHDLESDPG